MLKEDGKYPPHPFDSSIINSSIVFVAFCEVCWCCCEIKGVGGVSGGVISLGNFEASFTLVCCVFRASHPLGIKQYELELQSVDEDVVELVGDNEGIGADKVFGCISFKSIA